MKSTAYRILSLIALLTVTLLLFSACGGSALDAQRTDTPTTNNGGYDGYSGYEYEAAPATNDAYGGYEYPDLETAEEAEAGSPNLGAGQSPSLTQPQDGRMIIVNATLNVETLEYDQSISAIQAAIQNAGGYISASDFSGQSSYYYRSATITARVPAAKYDTFMQEIAGSGNIVSRSESSDDITAQYVDIEARLESLEVQKTRLTELAQSAGDLQDLLSIEERLSEVQYEIEYYTSLQRTYDDLVSYSTVTIYISEVVEISEPTPETFGQRVAKAFRQAWRNALSFLQEFFIGVVLVLPSLIFLAICGLAAFFIVRRYRRKHPKVKAPAAVPPYYGHAPAAHPQPWPQQAQPSQPGKAGATVSPPAQPAPPAQSDVSKDKDKGKPAP